MNTVNSSGYADFEWAIQLNRFSLKLIGLWPEETVRLRERLKSNLRLFCVIILITCISTVPSVHSLIKVWGDMTSMVDNMLFTLPLFEVSVKLIIMWWKKEALLPVMTMIIHDWIKTKSSNDRNVMIHKAQIARIIITINYVAIFLAMMVTVIASAFGYNIRHVTNITNTGKPLPMQGYYIYDVSSSPQYELTFFAQFVVLLIIAISYTGIDNFIGLLLFHVCGQLENLTNRLCYMCDSENFIDALKINVMDHVRLIRCVMVIEDTFTLMFFFVFFFFGTVFCVYGFLVVTVIIEDKNISIRRTTFLILVIFTAFIHICIYCIIGELLITKYEQVYKAVYRCNWYTLQIKEAKSLILLLIRANKPLYITAGKILPITMSTFCNILKTSGGYISILLANR